MAAKTRRYLSSLYWAAEVAVTVGGPGGRGCGGRLETDGRLSTMGHWGCCVSGAEVGARRGSGVGDDPAAVEVVAAVSEVWRWRQGGRGDRGSRSRRAIMLDHDVLLLLDSEETGHL